MFRSFVKARVRTQIFSRAHSARLFPHPGNRFLYFPEANYSLCHHDIHPRARRQQRRSPMQKGRAWTGTGTLRTPATIPCNTRFPIRHTRQSRNQPCPGIMRLTPTRMKMTLALTRISRARSNRQNGSPGPGLRKKQRDGGLKSGRYRSNSLFLFPVNCQCIPTHRRGTPILPQILKIPLIQARIFPHHNAPKTLIYTFGQPRFRPYSIAHISGDLPTERIYISPENCQILKIAILIGFLTLAEIRAFCEEIQQQSEPVTGPDGSGSMIDLHDLQQQESPDTLVGSHGTETRDRTIFMYHSEKYQVTPASDREYA